MASFRGRGRKGGGTNGLDYDASQRWLFPNWQCAAASMFNHLFNFKTKLNTITKCSNGERKKRTENAQQFCAMFPLCVCVCVCESVLHACHTGSWLHAPPTCRSVGCWVGRLNALMVGWMLRWLVRWLISTTPKGTQRAKEERKKREGREGGKKEIIIKRQPLSTLMPELHCATLLLLLLLLLL